MSKGFFTPGIVIGTNTGFRERDLKRFRIQVESMVHLFPTRPPTFILNTRGESIDEWRKDLTEIFCDLRFGIQDKKVILDIFSEVDK